MEPEVLSQDRSDDRIPCADEMCTGILDEQGVCGTCGRRGDRDEAAALRGDSSAPADAAAEAPRAEPDDQEPAPASTEPAADASLDDGYAVAAAPVDEDERVPCGDEMCVGVMGANGRCGTCGRNE